jgi:hypothetical protein
VPRFKRLLGRWIGGQPTWSNCFLGLGRTHTDSNQFVSLLKLNSPLKNVSSHKKSARELSGNILLLTMLNYKWGHPSLII